MNTQTYIDVSKRIRDNVTEINDIDIYNGQYEEPELFNSYNYPAVFIEWLSNAWLNNTDGSQQGLGGIKVHVVLPVVDQDTRNIDLADEVTQQARLSHLNVAAKVHKALNGYTPSGFITPLERVQDEPDHNYSEVLIITMLYTAEAIDDSTGFGANQWTTTQIKSIDVTGKVNEPS